MLISFKTFYVENFSCKSNFQLDILTQRETTFSVSCFLENKIKFFTLKKHKDKYDQYIPPHAKVGEPQKMIFNTFYTRVIYRSPPNIDAKCV